jgi:hypothetical protein
VKNFNKVFSFILLLGLSTSCGELLNPDGDGSSATEFSCGTHLPSGIVISTQRDFSTAASIFMMNNITSDPYLVSDAQSTDVKLKKVHNTFAVFNRATANLNYSIGLQNELVELTAQTQNNLLSAYDPTDAASLDCPNILITNRSGKNLVKLNIEDNTSEEVSTSLLKPFNTTSLSILDKTYVVVTSQGTNDSFAADGSQELELFEYSNGEFTSTHVTSLKSTHPVIISSNNGEVLIGGPCSNYDNDICTSTIQKYNVVTKTLTDLVDLSTLGYSFEFVESTKEGQSADHALLQAGKDGNYYIIEIDTTDGSVEEVHQFDALHRNDYGFESTAFNYSAEDQSYLIGEISADGNHLLIIRNGNISNKIEFDDLPKTLRVL